MFRFQPRYFIAALLLFLLEASIAYYWNDSFVRPIVGDFLVVILIFCALKSCLDIRTFPLAIGVLVFAFTVEGLQALNLIDHLGWQNSRAAHLIFGSTFDSKDLLAYSLGIGLILLLDHYFHRNQ